MSAEVGAGGTSLFRGVDHVGIGVGDMTAALEYWDRSLGFDDVVLDVTLDLPGMEEVTRRASRRARVVLLGSRTPTPDGPGRIKLVQVLDGDGPPPMPPGQAWGEVGICEVCLHVRDVATTHRRLVDELGCPELMEPLSAVLEPHGTPADLSYVSDAWDSKIELIEWTGSDRLVPGGPRVEGVNHVAFGVADLAATKEFYARMGFDRLVFESDGYFEPMRPWYAGEMPRQHMVLALDDVGAGIEPVELDPKLPDCRGEWGHLGPMEFAVGVTDVEAAVRDLSGAGVRFLGDVQSVEHERGTWRYVYLEDPDGLYVSLVETAG